MSILLFQFIDGLEISVEVVPDIIPRIARVVNIFVRPCIRENNFARVRSQISECIENVARWIVSLNM